jgi:hypothetical protein
MKIECHCGEWIVDQTDDLPHKGHLIPDQAWHALFDALDQQVIDALAARRLTRDGAYQRVRELLIRAVRPIWQCHHCGRVYVDDPHHEVHCYRPETGETDQAVLRGAE